MAKWAARDVKCPFFRSLTDHQLSCEGIDDNSVVRVDFKGKEGRRNHQECFCNSVINYKNCLIAQMLKGKYEDKQK